MTHRDATRPDAIRGHGDRPGAAGGRSAPTGAQRGGYTAAELDLIHATAAAHGLAIQVCSVVVPDGTFPPTPDGAPRPEVARILASLRKNSAATPRPAGFGTLADQSARSAQPAAGSGMLAVPADAPAPSRAASGVAYDREAYDLEASRRLAVATDHADSAGLAAGVEAVAADTHEAHRG